jgi:hypothetical protein
MSPELREFKANAMAELVSLKEIGVAVTKKLEGPVEITEAYSIVDKLWLPAEANRLKTELSGEFPDRNGSVILNSPLTGETSLLLEVPKTLEFMAKAFPEIILKVNEIYAQINNLGINNQEAIDKYNSFRKEPAKFADFVQDLWYPDSDSLQNGTVKTWKDIGRDSYRVENGDYLLMVDYGEVIRKSQDHLKECLLDTLVSQDMRLGDVDYRAEQLIGMIEMIGLFSDYLSEVDLG